MVDSMAGKNPNIPSDVTAVPRSNNVTLRLSKCLGCYWADPTNIQSVSNAALMDCSGIPDAKSRLASLRRRGIVEATLAEDNGVQRYLYRPTDTPEAREYIDKLPKGPCKKEGATAYVGKAARIAAAMAPDTTTPEQLAESNRAAEEFLLGLHEEARGPAQTRRHMLGCLACHLFNGTGSVWKGDLTRCTQRSDTSVRGLLRTLCDVNILEYAGTSGETRSQYTFRLATTTRAREFAELLTPPEVCDFKTAQQQAALSIPLEDAPTRETLPQAPASSPSTEAPGAV